MHQEGSWKDGPAGEMIGEEWGVLGNMEDGLGALARFEGGDLEGQRWKSAEGAGFRAAVEKQVESFLQGSRVIKVLHWHHRADAIVKTNHRLAVDRGRTGVSDGFVVHRIELGREGQLLTGA